MTTPRLHDGIRLVATRTAISCSRLFVAYTLDKWGAGFNLSKERLGNLDELVDAFHRIVRGEVVIDPYIISQLMSRRRIEDPTVEP